LPARVGKALKGLRAQQEEGEGEGDHDWTINQRGFSVARTTARYQTQQRKG
jgi:hypothetical protein